MRLICDAYRWDDANQVLDEIEARADELEEGRPCNSLLQDSGPFAGHHLGSLHALAAVVAGTQQRHTA